MAPDFLLRLTNISRFNGDKLILRNVSLDLHPGRVYLILGANGAGKTTLLRLLAGLAQPDNGRLERSNNIRTEYLAHAAFIYPALSTLQNMRFWAKASGIHSDTHKLMSLLTRVGLEGFAHEPARILSRGMMQRLSFARCLLSAPTLLLLDEPFGGLDSASSALMRDEIASCRQNGACVALSSHAPEQDGVLADITVRIEKGRLIVMAEQTQ